MKKILITLLIFVMSMTLVSCGHEHIFSSWTTYKTATCTENGIQRRTCSCGEYEEKTVTAKGHSYGSWTIYKSATCTENGIQRRTCSCGKYEEQKISSSGHSYISATCSTPEKCSKCSATKGSSLGHNYVNGICSRCKGVDETSDEYKYNYLKKKADALVSGCAQTVLDRNLKYPSSKQVYSQEILDSDDYFRYVVHIKYASQNSYGGYVQGDAYVLLRINCTMDGTFYSPNLFLGVKYMITDSDKESFGWGTEPEDWSLDINHFNNPVTVSLKLIIANPQDYVNKYVRITDDLVITSNSISNKSFNTYLSTGSGKYDYNNDISLYVRYHMCDNIEDLVMLDAQYQKITVEGYLRQYSDSTGVYIDAYKISINSN